jgi:hypothetical protein
VGCKIFFKLLKIADRYLFFSILWKRRELFYFLRYLKLQYCVLKENKDFTYIVRDLSKKNNTLTALCEKYGSDKGGRKMTNPFPHPPHNYTDFYEKLFKYKRKNITKVFECGIGTNDPNLVSSMGENAMPGSSLKAWRDYFSKAQIFGADIDRKILFSDDRIQTFYVDQTDKQSIREMWEAIGEKQLDIIIDDGLHAYDANICFFENSIDFLSEDGFYIIEDILIEEVNIFREYFNGAPFDSCIVDIYNPRDLINNRLIVIKKRLAC